MFVTYPDVRYLSRCSLPIRMCVGASSSPSITGLRHDRSGCALLPGARSAHDRRDEAHDPRQSRSDTSPPISQAVPGLQSGSNETHFVPPSSRETKPGTKLSLLNVPTPKPGQNSPCSTCPHPNRYKTLPARAKQPKFHAFGRAGRILSRTCPEVPRPGTFCPTTSCTLAR